MAIGMPQTSSDPNWQGQLPPQRLLIHRRFVRVALDPPDFKPGSWRGAGKVAFDSESGVFWLTTRPRTVGVRGYAVEIYSSRNGEAFRLANSMSKEEVARLCGVKVNSIEGQQMLKDPATDRYHLYLALDDGAGWGTFLLSSVDPAGPWRFECEAIKRGEAFDSREARDCSMGIVDGVYLALYKANNGKDVRTALATSGDGIEWRKRGPLKLDGAEQPHYHLLCGSFLAGSMGPIFVGFDSREVKNGAAVSNTLGAYLLDWRGCNLETIFRKRWKATTEYEKEPYPVHSYIDIIRDPLKPRYLMYVETIDPKHSQDFGVNLEVDRLLVFEVADVGSSLSGTSMVRKGRRFSQ